MNHTDTLLTLAQLSLGLAGFSGIIVALRQRGLEQWPRHELVRFRYMLELAVFSILFELLPLLISSWGVRPELTWRACSFALACWLVARIVQTAKIGSTVRNRLNQRWFVIYQVGSGLFALLMLANTAGVRALPSDGIYLTGLAWLLFYALSLFVRLTLSPIKADNNEP